MDISALAASLQHELQASLRSTGVVPPLSATHPFVQHALLPLVHSHSPTPSHEQRVSILRVLRVACAGSLPNALLLIELGVPSAVVQLVTSSYAQYLEDKQHSYDQTAPSEGTHDATITASVSVSVSDAEIKSLLTVASQVLANFSSCRDLHCSNESRPAAASLWAMGGVELFSSLLNMAVSLSAHNALSAIFAALHSCLLCPEVDAATELTSSRQICCQMALSVVDMKFAEMNTKDSANASASKSNNTSSENNANVEWFQIVVARLLKTGHVVRLLQVVKRTAAVLADITSASECFAVTMTHEEIIYLCALDTIISDISTLEEVTQSEIYFNHLKQLLQYIASLLIPAPGMISMHYPDVLTVDASSVAIDEKYALYLSSRCPILTPENDKAGLGVNAATTNLDLDSLSTPAASVCVNLLAKFSALSNSVLGERIATFSEQKEVFGSILKQELLEAGIMNICCSYLTGLNKIKTDKNNENAGTKKVALSSTEKSAAEFASDVARACLQVVMNMSFRCPKAQDYCRVIGGFTVVLSYCSTDFDSPLSREWALMCVRNLCEGNIENQEFVSSMQLRGVLKDELLEKQGIRVEMDPARGKFSFTQTKPSESGNAVTEIEEQP